MKKSISALYGALVYLIFLGTFVYAAGFVEGAADHQQLNQQHGRAAI